MTTTPTTAPVPAGLRSLPRSVATRRVNRTALALLGLLLTAGGVLTLLTAFGVFGADLAASPVVVPGWSRFAAATAWFWPVVAAVGLLVALSGLRWLVVQLRSNATREIDVEPDRTRGETVLAPSAVPAAVDAETAAYRGVDRATSSLRDDRGRTMLLVRVRLDGRVAVSEVREAIEDRAVAHARRALDLPDLPARVEITVSPRRVRRLH